MGGGVVEFLATIVVGSDDIAVCVEEHRPNRNVVVVDGQPGLAQGCLHCFVVG
jgi:hypothetical protein